MYISKFPINISTQIFSYTVNFTTSTRVQCSHWTSTFQTTTITNLDSHWPNFKAWLLSMLAYVTNVISVVFQASKLLWSPLSSSGLHRLFSGPAGDQPTFVNTCIGLRKLKATSHKIKSAANSLIQKWLLLKNQIQRWKWPWRISSQLRLTRRLLISLIKYRSEGYFSSLNEKFRLLNFWCSSCLYEWNPIYNVWS